MANHRMVMNQIIDIEIAVNREERRTHLREGRVTKSGRSVWYLAVLPEHVSANMRVL